jgi:hypothetical protein
MKALPASSTTLWRVANQHYSAPTPRDLREHLGDAYRRSMQELSRRLAAAAEAEAPQELWPAHRAA